MNAMSLNDAQVSTKPQHFVGYGYISADVPELAEDANKLCQVYDNAPRGFSRVYLKEGKKWVGPKIVHAEAVVLTV